MKKPRVVVETVISHRIYVEQDGERTLYAVADKVKEARALVRKAKRELGIAKNGTLHPGACRKPIQRSNWPVPNPRMGVALVAVL